MVTDFSRLPVRRDLQDRRAAQSAMREKDVLSKADAAAADFGFKRDTMQRVEILRFIEKQRHKGGPQRRYAQSELPGDAISEVGCAEFRNRQAAGRNDQRRAFEFSRFGRSEKLSEPKSTWHSANDLTPASAHSRRSMQESRCDEPSQNSWPDFLFVPANAMVSDQLKKAFRCIAASADSGKMDFPR